MHPLVGIVLLTKCEGWDSVCVSAAEFFGGGLLKGIDLTEIANFLRDFSDLQGENGWYFGGTEATRRYDPEKEIVPYSNFGPFKGLKAPGWQTCQENWVSVQDGALHAGSDQVRKDGQLPPKPRPNGDEEAPKSLTLEVSRGAHSYSRLSGYTFSHFRVLDHDPR